MLNTLIESRQMLLLISVFVTIIMMLIMMSYRTEHDRNKTYYSNLQLHKDLILNT